MGGQLRIRVRHEKYVTRWFDYLFVSREEMETILSGTGWKAVRFLGLDEPAYVAIMEKI